MDPMERARVAVEEFEAAQMAFNGANVNHYAAAVEAMHAAAVKAARVLVAVVAEQDSIENRKG